MAETTVTYRYGPPFPLKDVVVYGLLPLEHVQEVIHFLQAHQVQVAKPDGPSNPGLDDYYVLTFPEGTMEQRLFPIVESDRFLLTLPDGMAMLSVYNSNQNLRYAVQVQAIGLDLAAFEDFLRANPHYDTRPTFKA